MKKLITLLVTVVLCFSMSAAVYAEDIKFPEENVPNEAEEISSDAPIVQKNDKADVSAGDLIRYIPVTIDVTTSSVVVQGYFVNMICDMTVCDFTDFYMDVYVGGNWLVGGNFGTINRFSIYPLSMQYQSFTFQGNYTNYLNPGSYTCDDATYCVMACKFSMY